MKIVVTAENNNGLESSVAQHFGHALFFIFVDVENGEVVSTDGIINPFAETHEPGQIPQFIHSKNANVILSGGMGGRAIQFFEQLEIQAHTGVSGTVRQALEEYLGGTLKEAAPCAESIAHGHG